MWLSATISFEFNSLKTIMQQQYALIRHGRFSYSDLENMSYAEFEFFYKLLIDEEKQNQEAIKKK